MKLSKNHPVIRLTRWFLQIRGINRRMPTIFRFGGWIILFFYNLLGIKVLLLTTIGRKSGKARTIPAMYLLDGSELIIAAHQGGLQKHPHWYFNLLANPQVKVERFWRTQEFHAQVMNNDEERMKYLGGFPFGMVEALQAHTTRKIPVVRLLPSRATNQRKTKRMD